MTRTTPDASHSQLERWKDQDVLRAKSYALMANNHSLGRNGRVVRVLCQVSLLHGAGRFGSTGRTVTVSKAEFQNYKASAGHQAAHFLPGQLKVGGKNLSAYAGNPETRRGLDTIFADVDSLPADFNKADSQAEASGLCRAFADAALVIVRAPASRTGIDRALLKQAYHGTWVPQARTAFQAAIQSKGQKYERPPLRFGEAGGVAHREIQNLAEREDASNYELGIELQGWILEKYAEAMATEPREMQGKLIEELERGFRG
jgi:hypothetical protein